MAVSTQVNLPAQPTTGQVVQTPLGGGGILAPHLETIVEMVLLGDATGGDSTHTIQLDPRYASMVSYCFGMSGAGTAIDMIFEIFRGDLTDLRHVANLESTTLQPNAYVWSPPALILSGQPGAIAPIVRMRSPNVDSVNTTFSVLIYNFVKNVRELTPLSILFASLPRGGSGRS